MVEPEIGAALYLGRLEPDHSTTPDPQQAWIKAAAALTPEWSPSAESLHLCRCGPTALADTTTRLDQALELLTRINEKYKSDEHRPPRIDVVVWATKQPDPTTAIEPLGEAVDRLTNVGVLDADRGDKLNPHGDPAWRRWSVPANQPRRWSRIQGGHIAAAHTLETFNSVRVWLIATTLPYDLADGPCLSNLLEVEAGTGMPGPLALYISRLGHARGHFAANAYAARSATAAEPHARHALSAASNDPTDLIGQLSDTVATMRESVANLAPVNANLDGARQRLAAMLTNDFGVPTPALEAWGTDEALGDRQRDATMTANLGRHQARLDSLVAARQHADADHTRAATYLLAIVAGAAAVGALGDSLAWKIGLTITALGTLTLLATTRATAALLDPKARHGVALGTALAIGGLVMLALSEALDSTSGTGLALPAGAGLAAGAATVAIILSRPR